MNARVLRIELRRSVAPWAGAVVLVTALAFLYLISGPWWQGTVRWTAQWTPMALWTRGMLTYLWPIAVGLGALQGLRDHRSKMSELLTSTPRPTWHRAATLTGTTALTLASAFALLVLVGAVQVLANTEYTHLGWLPISLVGALSLVAGAVLGMGVGRALPSVLTPPALAAAVLVFTALPQPSTDPAEAAPGLIPNQVSLLSPAVREVNNVLLTLTASVHVGQTLWLLGAAVTGFLLLVATTPRARLLALAPVLAGAAIALLVLPTDPRRTYVLDEAAAVQVCDGPVCVTKTHQTQLTDLTDPAREALRLLHGALGDQAPTSVRETTATRAINATPERSRKAVLVDFDDGMIAEARGKELTRALVVQGMAPTCSPRSWRESGMPTELAAQSIAAGWVFGDLKPLGGTSHASRDQMALARPVWKKLKALPRAEQLSQIKAMHAAALSCKSDAFYVLAGGESR